MGKKKSAETIRAIDDLATRIADDIMKRDVGSRATISEIADAILELEGYKMVYQEDVYRWVWQNEKNGIYPLEHDDLFDVLDLVQKKLRNKRVLDFSEHEGLCEGLPFNLDFIITKPWQKGGGKQMDAALGNLLNKAIIFAVQNHAGTPRKGTNIPYIVHPMEVAAIVAGITDDEEVIAAAVLYDTLEDTETTTAELVDNFGYRVAALVGAESENKREDEKAEDTWKIRKEETIQHLTAARYDAKVIALGDKLANIRAIQRDYELLGDKF